MREWHYLFEGQQYGPITESDLVEFLKQGRLPRDTMVWTHGMSDWEVALRIDAILSQVESWGPSAPMPVPYRSAEPVSRSIARHQRGGASALAALDMNREERRSILQRREWTYLIDVIFINGICFVIGLILGVMVSAGNLRQSDLETMGMFLGWGIAGFYILFKDSLSGRSLGKSMTGLRVVDASTGRAIGAGKSMARNWIFLIPLFPIVELIVASSREDKRRLGDLMANTVVVKI